MITEEERAKLKVGDVVYWVYVNDNGSRDYFEYTIQSISEESLICCCDCGGAIFWLNGKNLFASEAKAVKHIISLTNEKIKSLEDYKNTFKQKLESLENGK